MPRQALRISSARSSATVRCSIGSPDLTRLPCCSYIIIAVLCSYNTLHPSRHPARARLRVTRLAGWSRARLRAPGRDDDDLVDPVEDLVGSHEPAITAKATE